MDNTNLIKLKCIITESSRIIGQMAELEARIKLFVTNSNCDSTNNFQEEFDRYSRKMNTLEREYLKLNVT